MLRVEPPPRYRMTAAPLVQAVAQVNFPIVPRLQTLEGIAPIQEQLSDLLPYLNQQVVQEVSLMVGPAGPTMPNAQSATINIFTDDDGWTLQVAVSSATLFVDGERYAGVDDFRGRLERVWNALYDGADVRRCDRLGVRYLDIVEAVGTEWASWFRREVIGLAHPDLSGSALASTITETRLRAEPAEEFNGQVEGVIRHGVVPPGSVIQGVPPRPVPTPSFLFDMDIFTATPEPFEPARLAEQFTTLHAELEKIFHWSITEDGRKHFGYKLIDETEGSQ